MRDRLDEPTRRELARLAERFGAPRLVKAAIRDAFFDPIKRPDRFGEVCMVIRRPSGNVVLSTKDFYPQGAFRLPTGGISHGEGVFDALLRETKEETGLDVDVVRFLAWIDYHGDAGGPRGPEPPAPLFHTFAFLLEETGGTLGSLDPHERISAYKEVAPGELPRVAAELEAIASEQSHRILGDWADWGRFRAVVHRAVAEVLAA